MRKLHYLSFFIICIALTCMGCGKKEEIQSSPFLDNIQLTLNEKQSTVKNHTHIYLVNLVNKNGESVDVDSINLKMEMKTMNHHVEEKMNKIKKGEYEVKLELPMEGTWSKQIILKEGNKERKISRK